MINPKSVLQQLLIDILINNLCLVHYTMWCPAFTQVVLAFQYGLNVFVYKLIFIWKVLFVLFIIYVLLQRGSEKKCALQMLIFLGSLIYFWLLILTLVIKFLSSIDLILFKKRSFENLSILFYLFILILENQWFDSLKLNSLLVIFSIL